MCVYIEKSSKEMKDCSKSKFDSRLKLVPDSSTDPLIFSPILSVIHLSV